MKTGEGVTRGVVWMETAVLGAKRALTPVSTNFRPGDLETRVVGFVWTEMDIMVVVGGFV